MNKKTKEMQTGLLRLPPRRRDGSVMLVAMITVLILLLMIGATLLRTTNKYFTAYQWASWQEALQGAESGADIAMAEMRKDISTTAIPWVGWNVGNYKTVNGVKTKDTSSYHLIGSDGNFANNNGNGGGNQTKFNINYLTGNNGWDFVTYSTQLTPHAGEGNNNLRITVTVDSPSTLVDSSNRRWLRVRATGTTDLAGPSRVSEEQLDNRLRKLGLFWDKVLAATNGSSAAGHQTTRQIELVAKPVTMFAGALTAMVQIKSDNQGLWTDSFNSEDPTHWPTRIDGSGNSYIDMTVSHDPTQALGKNGDVASNAFPIKHDHSENLDLTTDIIYGDVGNNYSLIKNLDPLYYTTVYNPATNAYGLDNGSYTNTNPTPSLIQTNGGADVSGAIATNYYRDLPAVQDPTWQTDGSSYTSYTKVDNKTPDVTTSTDPSNPTKIIVSGDVTLANKDLWTLKAPAPPKGWVPGVAPAVGYVQIWVKGNVHLDDGGTIVLQNVFDKSGNQESYVQAQIYIDHDIKVGENKETKTNSGGFDVQSDDAKDLTILGVTQPDSGKMPKDDYLDPLGNDALYTPYKASGNIVFTENDFTGAIYAPDHNIVFNNSTDGRGKRHKRVQNGADFYGSYVGRTINNKKGVNVHYDESLNDAGNTSDWGYVSWFEDVDVDHR